MAELAVPGAQGKQKHYVSPAFFFFNPFQTLLTKKVLNVISSMVPSLGGTNVQNVWNWI